jgi:hypothetical protein
MATDDELVNRGVRIFRTIAGRRERGLCAQRLGRFRGPDYTEATYCPSVVARAGAMYCEPHEALADADARDIEARMASAEQED